MKPNFGFSLDGWSTIGEISRFSFDSSSIISLCLNYIFLYLNTSLAALKTLLYIIAKYRFRSESVVIFDRYNCTEMEINLYVYK